MTSPRLTRAHFGALTAAAVLFRPLGATAQGLTTLRVATLPIDNGAEVFYGIERGLFTKAGLSIDLHSMNNGAAVVAAVSSGAVDVGFSNLFSIVGAFSKGIPVQVIAPAALYEASSPAQALLTLKDGTIKTVRDLNGKTIAVDGVKGITQVTVAAYIDGAGGDSSSVHWIEMPDPLMTQALIDHRVDAASAAMSDNPDAGKSTSVLRILAYPYESVGKRFLASGWFASKSWVAEHPDLARKFASAIVASGKWANANKAASGLVLSKYTKLPPERVAEIANNRAVYDESALRAATLEPIIAFSAKHGLIPTAFPAATLAPALPG